MLGGMARIVLFLIVSEGHLLEKWVCAATKHKGFVDRVLKRIHQEGSKIIRSVQMEELWLYFFQQEGFLFVLGAEGADRSARMQNYLRIITEIFYQNYDERNFPTVLDRIIGEINRIETGESHSPEEYEGLIKGSGLKLEKERLQTSIKVREAKSQRAFFVTVGLLVAIVILAVWYFWKKP